MMSLVDSRLCVDECVEIGVCVLGMVIDGCMIRLLGMST